MKRHRGERDYPCSHCDYKAFTKVDLSRHQTIHTGERNKICEFCGKAFAKDSTLRDHVKAIHERKVTHACEIVSKEASIEALWWSINNFCCSWSR